MQLEPKETCCHCCDDAMRNERTSSKRRRRRARSLPLAAMLAAALAAIALQLPSTAEALELQLAHGDSHRLRQRSISHLQDWAVAERQRIVGRYGPGAAGLAQGLQPRQQQQQRRHTDSLQARQVSIEPSGSTSRTAPAASSTSRETGSSASVGPATVSTPNNRTINPRTGFANLTNYQSDLCVLASLLRLSITTVADPSYPL